MDVGRAGAVRGNAVRGLELNRQPLWRRVGGLSPFIDAMQHAGLHASLLGVELISEKHRKLPLDEMAKARLRHHHAQFSANKKRDCA